MLAIGSLRLLWAWLKVKAIRSWNHKIYKQWKITSNWRSHGRKQCQAGVWGVCAHVRWFVPALYRPLFFQSHVAMPGMAMGQMVCFSKKSIRVQHSSETLLGACSEFCTWVVNCNLHSTDFQSTHRPPLLLSVFYLGTQCFFFLCLYTNEKNKNKE